MSKNLDETVRIQSEKRVDTRDKRETTRDCRGRKERSQSGQLISRVVPREKRVSGDPFLPDRTGERR